MKGIFSSIFIVLGFSFSTAAQTETTTITLCKDLSLPEGYVIIGEGEAAECPKGAWLIKRRAASKKPERMTDQPKPVDPPVTPTEPDKKLPGDNATGTWKLVHAEADGFSVSLPEGYEKTSRGLSGVTGNAYHATLNNIDYFILSVDIGGNLPQGFDKERALNEFVEGYGATFIKGAQLQGVDIDLKFEGHLKLNKHKGRQYRILSNVATGVLRFYLTGKRVYVVQVIGGTTSDKLVSDFLKSFQLTQ